MKDKITLTELVVPCKIGIFDWERKVKQKISITIEFPANIPRAARFDDIRYATDYKAIAKHIIQFVSESQFYLIETLAERLALSLLQKFALKEIKLSVSKPGAIRGAKNVGIEIVRKRRKK